MIFKEIELDNKQILVIYDLSRKISVDAFLVIMEAIIEIKIERQLFFDKILSDDEFEDIIATLGDTVRYKYRVERNFIMATEKDVVFNTLVETFLDNLGQYISKPEFPYRLVLKEYKDKTN